MIAKFESWLFAPGDARRLAAVRIGLCLLLAERLTRHVYLDLAGQPSELFRPLSFMRFLDRMPSREVVVLLQAVGISAAILAALGARARLTLPVAWGCGVFLGGMTTSIGKVVHNDVLLLLAMAPLLAAPLDGRTARAGWPVRAAQIVAAGGFFLAGLQKLLTSGPAWVFSGNMRWIMYTSSDQHALPNPAALFIADRPWLASLVAACILGLELGFPLALVRPRIAPLFVGGAVVSRSASAGRSGWTTPRGC